LHGNPWKRSIATMQARRALVTGLAGALLVLGVGWFVQRTHDPSPVRRSSSVDVSAVLPGRTVYVESGVPSTTFLPLGVGPQDGRTLSAQRAYNLLVSHSAKLQPIPATVRPYYGLLTDGSASPMATGVRVWAFAVESGCTYAGGAGPSPTATPSRPTRCRLWEFVNATTGHDLGVVSQEVLPD
jgi:hypothetical protein